MAEYNVDSHFWKGRTHKVCEDYALSFSIQSEEVAVPYIIVCDGCSSSPNTDVGARVLAHSAAKHISDFGFDDNFTRRVIYEAGMTIESLGLRQESLDATLLIGKYEGGKFSCEIFGDGVIAYKTPNELGIYIVEYESNAPEYLSYNLDQTRYDVYMDATDGERNIDKIILTGDDTVVQAVKDIEIPEDATMLSLMSDGVCSFMKAADTSTYKKDVQMAPAFIIKQLVDYKMTNGEFVHRRVRGFEKAAKSNRWYHDDDVSVATIHLR